MKNHSRLSTNPSYEEDILTWRKLYRNGDTEGAQLTEQAIVSGFVKDLSLGRFTTLKAAKQSAQQLHRSLFTRRRRRRKWILF